MCNVTIAKKKLQRLRKRTEKDLYVLKYGSEDFITLNDNTYYLIKTICNKDDLVCPIYKYDGKIQFKHDVPSIFTVLHTLANEHNIYLDYTEIPQ